MWLRDLFWKSLSNQKNSENHQAVRCEHFCRSVMMSFHETCREKLANKNLLSLLALLTVECFTESEVMMTVVVSSRIAIFEKVSIMSCYHASEENNKVFPSHVQI